MHSSCILLTAADNGGCGGCVGFLAMRTSVALTERAHEALRLFQSITGRTFSDIVNELLLAEIERQGLTAELDERIATPA